MAIINKPTIVKGEANEIDLSKSDLAAVSKVVNDSYFSDFNNWFKVAMEYESDTGDQIEMLIFDASQASPKTNFEISDKSKNNWQIKSIIIMDFDGGYLKLQRGDLTVENFDIALGSVGGDIVNVYTTFNQLSVLRPNGLDANDYFGYSVAVSGNYVVVGAYQDDGANNSKSDSGAAYVYKIGENGTVTLLSTLRPSELNANDRFGQSVAIDGNYIVVGAPYDDGQGSNSGIAYVYKIDQNDSVVFIKTLSASLSIWAADMSLLESGDYFGNSVGISGNYIIVGARSDDTISATNSGMVYVFKIVENDVIRLTNTLRPTGLDSNDLFGYSVAISENYIIVGAIDDAGAGNNILNSGAAYVYKINENNVITLIGTLRPDEPEILGRFGWSVSTSGNYIVIGAYNYDGVNINSGAAYVYKIGENDVITLLDTLRPTELDAGDNFGYSVSIDGNYIVAGARYDEGADNSKSISGAAYVFKINQDETITQIGDPLRPDELDAGDSFGSSVAVSGNYIVVGVPYDDGADNSKSISGATYIFKGV